MKHDYQSYCNSILVNDEVYYRRFSDKIELYSYGCPDSMWDIESLAGFIDPSKADKPVVIIDTCCAIDLQENISKRVVDRVIKIYTDSKNDTKILLLGCGVTYDYDYYKKYEDKYENIYCFTNDIKKETIYPYNRTIEHTEHMSGNIKISDGCYFNCAYCTIKNVRPHYMFTPEEVIAQIKKSVNNGFTDICLFGTEISLYNSICKFGKHINLTCLIRKILDEIPEITSIKLDSINPGFRDIDNLVKLIKEEPKMQKELDLAVQSCSDTILKAMKRPYTSEDVIHVCKIAKGLDIQFQLITGFPGETDELFNESLEVIKQLSPDRITLCPFSARKGTRAYDMPYKVPHETAKQREQILINVVRNSSNQKIERENIAQFNEYKPKSLTGCQIIEADLYDTNEFVRVYKQLQNRKNSNIIIYYNFDKNKCIEDLDINIKLLMVTFGAKIIGRVLIDDDTIKINYPRLITNDLLTFVDFDFSKLKSATEEDVTKFFADLKECQMDDFDTALRRFIYAGNRKFLVPLAKKLNMDVL